MPISADTIYALATPPGRSGVAVVRLSGPQVPQAAEALGLVLPQPRQASLQKLRHPSTGETIDRGLVLFFEAPRSFTGEAVLELHVHGGRAILAELFDALGRLARHRPAEPGEFARRAFENGKLDLSEAEGLADLIDAETTAQKKQAMRQMEGALTQVATRLRAGLLRSLAYLEAFIDFPDEEIPAEAWAEAEQEIILLQAEIAHWLSTATIGESLRDGWFVTILGIPNAGKSSLLNLLARRDAAIVSGEAGTTRDLVEVRLHIGPWPIILSDTAGLREAADAVEREGMRRARERAAKSELRIFVLDSSRSLISQESLLASMQPHDIVLVNKVDLPSHEDFRPPGNALSFSSITGAGLDNLLQKLQDYFGRFEEKIESSILTRNRHRLLFLTAHSEIGHALSTDLLELRTEHLRLAAQALASIIGAVNAEELLDAIFSQFCLGK